MNAIRVSKPVGRRFGTLITATLMILMGLQPLNAAQIVITIKGNLQGGADRFPLFDVGRDWDGKPFTLVLTFDDAKGKPTPSELCPNSGSGLTGDFASSPGTAVLTVGTKSYTFGTRKDSHSSVWRAIAGPCSDSAIDFAVNEGNGLFSPGKTQVSVRIGPAPGKPSLTQNPDWRAPLSTTELDDNGSGIFISKPGDFQHETKSGLAIKSITIAKAKS
jgi:hypothetical protein